jgi:hypothetical protein
VDLVVHELQTAIGTISARLMSRYPMLREETERIIMGRIGSMEQKCKDYFDQYVDVQQAYINTNHEDFIGELFCA